MTGHGEREDTGNRGISFFSFLYTFTVLPIML